MQALQCCTLGTMLYVWYNAVYLVQWKMDKPWFPCEVMVCQGVAGEEWGGGYTTSLLPVR